MQSMDWNEASSIGLIEKINAEMLHPLGLALARDPLTGQSPYLLIAPDGVFNFKHPPSIKTNQEITDKIKEVHNVAI